MTHISASESAAARSAAGVAATFHSEMGGKTWARKGEGEKREGGHFGRISTCSTCGLFPGRPRERVVAQKPVRSQVSSVHFSLPYGRLRMTESRIVWNSFIVRASLTRCIQPDRRADRCDSVSKADGQCSNHCVPARYPQTIRKSLPTFLHGTFYVGYFFFYA